MRLRDCFYFRQSQGCTLSRKCIFTQKSKILSRISTNINLLHKANPKYALIPMLDNAHIGKQKFAIRWEPRLTFACVIRIQHSFPFFNRLFEPDTATLRRLWLLKGALQMSSKPGSKARLAVSPSPIFSILTIRSRMSRVTELPATS